MSDIAPKDISNKVLTACILICSHMDFILQKAMKSEKQPVYSQNILFSQSRNYISSSSGSVETEIHCLLNTKEYEGVYRVTFGKGSID